MAARKRFLDDLWFGWRGTEREFKLFKTALNKVGKEVAGMTFSGDVGESIDFLDVTVSLTNCGSLQTKLYVKPTDASRYLNRRSDHGLHTFTSIPFSQFRRAVVLSSDAQQRDQSLDYITKKLHESGYKQHEIDDARTKALQLDRVCILSADVTRKPEGDVRQLIFTINRDNFMRKKIKQILDDNQDDINDLLGCDTRLLVAERRNQNIASSLFAKSSFSREKLQKKDNQKCYVKNCGSCKLMNIDETVTLWKDHPNEVAVKLDYTCNCSFDCIIYLYICKLCPNNRSFYVGQSINTCRGRANGHRGDFNLKSYAKSALSMHMYKDHPQNFDYKLQNYDLGIIEATSALNLDRKEDFYLELTKAHLSLNRYKVTR